MTAWSKKVASPCRRRAGLTASVLMCSSSKITQAMQKATGRSATSRRRYTRVTSEWVSSQTSVSRDHGLVNDSCSRATIASRSAWAPGSRMRSTRISGAAGLLAAIAGDFGVGPAHVERHDGMRGDGATGRCRSDEADRPGERRHRRRNFGRPPKPLGDQLVITNGSVAGKRQPSAVEGASPGVQDGVGRARRRLVQHPPVRVVERRVDLAAMRVDPDSGHVRRRSCDLLEGFERRHRHHRPALREREALDCRDADAESGERAGADRDREAIDRVHVQLRLGKQRHQLARQALAVRTRRISGALDHDRAVAHDCGAARRRRGVERENGQFCNVILAAIPPMSSPTPSSTSSEPAGATPAMRQYFDAKRQYRDALVFFRMGDFYEMFYEDALTAARAPEPTLTSPSKDASGGATPTCGVPFHAADTYIARLVRNGFRVAVCEQVEDPRKAKGVVRREVVRVVSPGTLTDAGYLEAREPAFLMGIFPASPAAYGVALLDVSTGEFTTTEYDGDDGRQALADELVVLRPR